MTDGATRLLDLTGQWTHRDRQQHHRFPLEVPAGVVELQVRLRWGPVDMGSEHEQNSIAMSLFGPDGYRGAAAVQVGGDQRIGISESTATLGTVAGPVAAGSWTINIDAGEILNDGAETGHLTYHLEARATVGGGSTRETSAPAVEAIAPPKERLTEPAGPRWFRGDLHTHTTHSDGTITVEDRVRGAVERGMDFLAITDHNTVSHHREIGRWPDVIMPIRASEVTTFHGHMNCFGLREAIDWRDDARGGGAAGIIEQAHRQDALISINHPNAFGDPWCTGCHWDYALVDFATIDAIEVWNGRWAIPETANLGALALWTDLLDAGFRPTAISGSDSHSAEEDDYIALPMTYVHAPDRSEAAILDGIRRGRVFISSGPKISFRARGSDGVDVVVPGGRMPADGSLELTVDVDGVEAPATLRFVTSGSVADLATCDPGSTRVEGVRLEARKWWRLELRSASEGDLLALTNPVFV